MKGWNGIPGQSNIPFSEGFIAYYCRLAYMAVPLALENSLWYASNIISTIFIGHLGKHELAAVVLGESVFNVTGTQPICAQVLSLLVVPWSTHM